MFVSSKFTFNGIHCDDMNMSLISTDSEVLNKYGLDYKEDITMIKGRNTSSYYAAEKSENESFVLKMVLADENNVPLEWDEDTINDIFDWLITDNFSPFISEDNEELIYYFKVTNISKMFTYDMKGYLEVTFMPFSNFAYKSFNKKIIVEDELEVSIMNSSNINENYCPLIKIKNLGDRLNIINIKNKTLDNEEFSICDIDEDDIVTIDNLIGSVVNEYNDNLIMKCNRKWIRLKKGKNVLNISGNAELEIICLFPVRA